MWSEGRTFILRSAIFVGLASVVTTIIYFTPVPDQSYISSQCERPCHELEMPMICRLRLTLEPYETLTRFCGDCPKNASDCFRRHCIPGDGVRRPLLTANRQLPGPNIQVCENDILVVDVMNRLPGRELTVHWRGQPQKETPFMDGVAMVTQCPIPSATTFQYKFRASRAGTHFWHAHQTGRESDHLFGALIVRQAGSKISERDLYDIDDGGHVIVVSAFSKSPRGDDGAVVINGRSHVQRDGAEYLPASFIVTQGNRYRFRLANAGGTGCPISVSVDSHPLLVIALDGNLVVPREVDTIVLATGERADFILHANQRNASYRLHASTSAACVAAPGVALVRYSGADSAAAGVTETNLVETGVVQLRSAFSGCGDDVCVTQLQSTVSMPEELRRPKMDATIYLAFGYRHADTNNNQTPWTEDGLVPYFNNITFTSPSSSVLTQSDEMTFDLCSEESRPARCDGAEYCHCVHVVEVPLEQTVELLLVDEGGTEADHVFHLHGYKFHVAGAIQLPRHVSLPEVRNMDERGELMRRNLDNPVVKDTIVLPHLGVAALRFKADNPGYWLLEGHRGGERMAGMSVVLHVGRDGDTPPTPQYFPRCGSWVGPDFFLI